ncbi:MAG: Na-translocating system protein MpsC family protein [Clostridia bacterium]|nr:Na-translocating system protein MpsC family protein [Clostridia bacterium]
MAGGTLEIEGDIAAIVSRVIKESTGKGPRNVTVYIKKNMVLTRMEGFMFPGETKLAKSKDGMEQVMLFRKNLKREVTLPVLSEEISNLVGQPITRYYFDLQPEINEGVAVFLTQGDLE